MGSSPVRRKKTPESSRSVENSGTAASQRMLETHKTCQAEDD